MSVFLNEKTYLSTNPSSIQTLILSTCFVCIASNLDLKEFSLSNLLHTVSCVKPSPENLYNQPTPELIKRITAVREANYCLRACVSDMAAGFFFCFVLLLEWIWRKCCCVATVAQNCTRNERQTRHRSSSTWC